MDIARINCAHGTKKEWKLIIDAIHNAEERLTQQGQAFNRRCRIVMDLVGPKIRIGPMPLAVRPLQITVPKDVHKKRIKMVEGYLDSEAQFTEKISLTGIDPIFVISVSKGKEVLPALNVGESLSFVDAKGRLLTMVILERTSHTRIRIGIEKTIYLQEGLRLNRQKKSTLDRSVSDVQSQGVDIVNPYLHDPIKSIPSRSNEQDRVSVIPENNNIGHHGDREYDSILVGRVSPQLIDVKVTSGDKLILLKTANKDQPALNTTEYNNIIKISCTMPEILHKIQQGNRVFIDDGKIEAVVLTTTNDYLVLKIVSPSDTTAKIRIEKGLNFPDSELSLSAITSEEIGNLSFIVSNATAVALSFVHSSQDILDLRKALVGIGKLDSGIIAKIETRNGIHNLSRILLSGLDLPKFGALIARGDLAVEIGFENLSIVQEDILCLCEAAHIPVILATQMLETLAKSGLPTRAEITDAAIGYRAECVMLNKGKHVLEAVRLLSFLSFHFL